MPPSASLFLFLFVPILSCVLLTMGLLHAFLKSRQNNQIREMLRTADPVTAERTVEILKPQTLENSLEEFLENLGVAARVRLLLEQAGASWNPNKLIFACALFACMRVIVGLELPHSPYSFLIVPGLAASLGYLPVLGILRKRKKRIRAFEEQFPEALDFLSRSMRAGHAFSVGLEMLVTDSPEPLASVFRRALGDLHLGSPLEVGLGKLITLVPLIDVRFFVSSVLLQQETGGNLSEILSKLAQVIRERFRIKGQVRAASAHGKITGMVLTFMPIVVGLLMLVISPSYLMILLQNHTGRLMLLGSALAQVLGYLCIRKITNIKV